MKCSRCGCTVSHENELDKMNCGQGGVHEYMGKLYSRRKLEAENAKLRECVEYYADTDVWQYGLYPIGHEKEVNQIQYDKDSEYEVPGKRARQCLKEIEGA